MGACISHQVEYPDDVHPNIFTVAILERGGLTMDTASTSRHLANGGRYGQLEVTPTTLILHCRGAKPLDWPLTYVRRYGYENNLFSFESGRRCQCQGIFTFRCRQAERLFGTVQLRLREQRRNQRLRRIDEYATTSSVVACPAATLTSSADGWTVSTSDVRRRSATNRDRLSSVHTSSSRVTNDNDDFDESVAETTSTLAPKSQSYHAVDIEGQSVTQDDFGDISARPVIDNGTVGYYCSSGSTDKMNDGFSKNCQIFTVSGQRHPLSPVEVYYENVDPHVSLKIRSASSAICVNHLTVTRTASGRARSASSGNNQFNCENYLPPISQRSFCEANADLTKPYINLSELPNNEKSIKLQYVLVDLGADSPTTTSFADQGHENSWSSCAINGDLMGHSRKTSSLSGSSVDRRPSVESGGPWFETTAKTNYVTIDCTMTKALKETAAQHRYKTPRQRIDEHTVTKGLDKRHGENRFVTSQFYI